jgi:hypothetical protein
VTNELLASGGTGVCVGAGAAMAASAPNIPAATKSPAVANLMGFMRMSSVRIAASANPANACLNRDMKAYIKSYRA